jgi:hypothetical protein
MPTQILRPQGAGAKTDIASQYPTSGEHWDKVDEATPDDASTYVRHNLTSYASDTYALPAGAGVGEIDSVKVVARCYGISGNYNYAKTVLRTHSNFYEGAAQQLSANWQNISTEYALNPYTNQPWTWAEVDALEAGVALKSSSSGEFFAICTQVYVEVTYHTETPKTSADAGSGAESLPAQANIIAGADSGSGAMASSPTASFARDENGSSVEALSFLASFLRDESGSASEQPENRSAVSAESSQGNESSNLLATREAADSGNASDAATGQASFTPEEIGTGNEGAPATEATFLKEEAGAGSDSAAPSASAYQSEIGSAAEALLTRTAASDEPGAGLDETLSRLLSDDQVGNAQEITVEVVKESGDKDMQRADSGGGQETVYDRLVFLPEQGIASESLLSHELVAREEYGHALHFDGVDDYVDCGNGSSLDLTSAVTLEAWLKLADVVGAQMIIGKRGSTTNYALRTDGDELLFYFSNDGWNIWSATADLLADTWYYIACVYTAGSDPKIYVNGVLKSGFWNLGSAKTMEISTAHLTIGKIPGGDPLEGLIAQMRISNTARTQDEISANWNNGKGRKFDLDENTVALWRLSEAAGSTVYDETSNNNDGTIYGASWAEGFGFPSSQETASLASGLAGTETGAGSDSLLARLLDALEDGTGIESLFARQLEQSESGSGNDASLAWLSALIDSENGSGSDALASLMASLAATIEAGLGSDSLPGKEMLLTDSGSGLDVAALYKIFLAVDSGVGLEALAILLALTSTSETGLASEQLIAKVMTPASADEMRLPTGMSQVNIPAKEVKL